MPCIPKCWVSPCLRPCKLFHRHPHPKLNTLSAYCEHACAYMRCMCSRCRKTTNILSTWSSYTSREGSALLLSLPSCFLSACLWLLERCHASGARGTRASFHLLMLLTRTSSEFIHVAIHVRISFLQDKLSECVSYPFAFWWTHLSACAYCYCALR